MALSSLIRKGPFWNTEHSHKDRGSATRNRRNEEKGQKRNAQESSNNVCRPESPTINTGASIVPFLEQKTGHIPTATNSLRL